MSKESSKTSVEVKADVERYKIMLYTLNEAINRLAGLRNRLPGRARAPSRRQNRGRR